MPTSNDSEFKEPEKADFDDAYVAPTPHRYLAEMRRVGYQIGEQARPIVAAVARLSKEQNGEAWPAQMLDIGCSYGLTSMFVKYGVSFEELVSFFHSRAPHSYEACVHATRAWLGVVPPAVDLRVVGIDVSEPAIRFARESGVLDGGITSDLEAPDAVLTPSERAWLRGCNIMVSTGAIGYVTERTLSHVLHELGRDYVPTIFGPSAIFTVLRMFDASPIKDLFTSRGWRCELVDEVRLPQRAFADEQERDSILATLKSKGLDTQGWESRGVLYADLLVAAPESAFSLLYDTVASVGSQRNHQGTLFDRHTQVARGRLY